MLGGDEALGRLVDAAHERGMRVMGDFTTNHTGDAHEWFVAAQQDPDAEERGYYFWEGEEYVAWLGVPSLPKLNYDSAPLRHRVFEDKEGVVRQLAHRRQPPRRLAGRRGQHDGPLPRPGPQPRRRAADARWRWTRLPPTPCSWASTATTTPRTRRATAGTA